MQALRWLVYRGVEQFLAAILGQFREATGFEVRSRQAVNLHAVLYRVLHGRWAVEEGNACRWGRGGAMPALMQLACMCSPVFPGRMTCTGNERGHGLWCRW
eukprot:365379-Chlamydomonas_euryale.AAC.5